MGKRSQRDRITSYLKSGKKITPLLALNRFGCLRLSARIMDIKEDLKDSHIVYSERYKTREGKYVARYWAVKMNGCFNNQ